MRTLKSKDEQVDQDPSLNSIPDATPPPGKRRCISSACIPCRKRKSKCDGGKPFCSTCTAVYHTECFYDLDSDHRRKAALKRDIENLREQNGALGVIVASLRTSTDAEAAEIVQQIRADEDLDHLAENLKRNVTLNDRLDGYGAENDLANLIGKPSVDVDGVVKHFGSTSSLGLVSGRTQPPIPPRTSDSWTTVTNDLSLIRHLLDLYFCWTHEPYPVLSKELFLYDMERGASKHCSSLLVNAMCALGCAYSDRPEIRTNPADSKTAGDAFMAEARRLLECSESCLTAVQALAIMGVREASSDNDSRGFQYAGRCMRMAIELGLHLSFGADSNKFDETELEVRKITFWGVFMLDTAWSICVGRVSGLPRAAINLEMPSIVKEIESKPWQPYTDYGLTAAPGNPQPALTYTLLQQHSLLAEIVNDTVYSFYAPRERFTSRKLLDFHNRYTRWYSRLPESLQLRETSSAHVYTVHLFYHTAVLHLFRPFLKVDLTNSAVSPREVCAACAAKVASLLRDYRKVYGLRRQCLILCHITLSSSIIYLINLPDPTAVADLKTAVTVLKEMSTSHAFANRILDIIGRLAKQWNKKLPVEIQQAVSSPKYSSTPTVLTERDANIYQTPSVGANATYGLEGLEREKSTNDSASFQAPIKDSPKPVTNTLDLFWSPFPDVSLPLSVLQPSGPMDIMSVVDNQEGNEWMRLSRDGFKFAGGFDPSVGAPEFAQAAAWS